MLPATLEKLKEIAKRKFNADSAETCTYSDGIIDGAIILASAILKMEGFEEEK